MVDPASDWPLFAEKMRQLLSSDKVAAVFGRWTSVSRKSVLPIAEELNGRFAVLDRGQVVVSGKQDEMMGENVRRYLTV